MHPHTQGVLQNTGEAWNLELARAEQEPGAAELELRVLVLVPLLLVPEWIPSLKRPVLVLVQVLVLVPVVVPDRLWCHRRFPSHRCCRQCTRPTCDGTPSHF